MKRKNIFKTVVIVAVALAFIMPGSAAFAHVKETASRSVNNDADPKYPAVTG